MIQHCCPFQKASKLLKTLTVFSYSQSLLDMWQLTASSVIAFQQFQMYQHTVCTHDKNKLGCVLRRRRYFRWWRVDGGDELLWQGGYFWVASPGTLTNSWLAHHSIQDKSTYHSQNLQLLKIFLASLMNPIKRLIQLRQELLSVAKVAEIAKRH